MLSMEVVEVNPVIDEVNRTADLAVEMVMSGSGETHPMKPRVAVIYGGRSGEHEISMRSAKSIMQGWTPRDTSRSNTSSTNNGKWSPRPILPEPGAHPEIDVISGPARHLRRRRHGAGAAGTGRPCRTWVRACWLGGVDG